MSAQGKLQTPHSIAVDDCVNALYVADRDAGAVRRFHMTGKFAGAAEQEPLPAGASSTHADAFRERHERRPAARKFLVLCGSQPCPGLL